MKRSTFFLLVSLVVFDAFAMNVRAQSRKNSALFPEEDEDVVRMGRDQYDQLRLRDPATNRIPENIRAKELRYAMQLRAADPKIFPKRNVASTASVDWVSRGPSNIGARTRALGIDVANEHIFLAGGTSGGTWRSTDQGNSWTRTTSLAEMPSTTCLAQDIRPGKTNTWYYGTGETNGNTAAYPLWLNDGPYGWGEYFGNGIYKSTDGGLSWSVLPSTKIDSIGALIQPFNIVNAISVDPSNTTQDIVYAAVAGGVERSSDGGATWSMVLGQFPTGSFFTDVKITTHGVVYALLGLDGISRYNNSSISGIYRSTDGIHWVNITPSNWKGAYEMLSLAIAPSNENVMYIATNGTSSGDSSMFWKYTYRSGDGSGSGGVFEDRSANMIGCGVGWASYTKVNPDDENTVFVGGLTLVRSTDGFATTQHITGVNVPHVDQASMAFFPSNSASMVVGCDGGMFQTDDNRRSTVYWNSLNTDYVATQFYTVAIDHSTPGDLIIVGGLQDNSTNFTNTLDAEAPWTEVSGGDGATCAIATGKSSYYVSIQWGLTYRLMLDNFGNEIGYGRIDPVGSGIYPFINPFCLDPNFTDRMYFGGGNFLWRHDSLPSIPLGDATTSYGWTKLSRTTVTEIGSVVPASLISFVAASTKPANRVYYGTTDGQLFRIDNANVGNPATTSIWRGKGFPASAYLSSIAIDPANADNVIVAFANYNIQSLFSTSDGGTTWTAIGGNLEEFPDGTGNGPSFRTAAILHSGSGIVYLVGTSTGLYSTTMLNGMSTVWTLEGAGTIGNSIVNMIDTRASDGMVAVATCGHGMFSGQFAPASAVIEDPSFAFTAQNFPNPITTTTDIKFDLIDDGFVTLKIYDMLGREITTLLSANCSRGHNSTTWDVSTLPSGTYYFRLTSGSLAFTRQLIVAK